MEEQYHKEERIRHANAPRGTEVWLRNVAQSWKLTDEPIWSDRSKYIVDDEWSEIRKAHLNRKTIEFQDEYDKWVVRNLDTQVMCDITRYRIKSDEPLYYYQWEKMLSHGAVITVTEYVLDDYAEKNGYKKDGWRKIENSRRTWDE